jgi:hypothetical protein
MKEKYIAQIFELLQQCQDMEILEIILQLLQKCR